MMQLLELMPLVAFFTAYKFSGETIVLGSFQYPLDGIYGATAVLMVATLIQLIIVWLWKRQIEKRLWWLVAAVFIFGSATLLFHDQRFIQWKPTIFNWVMSLIMLGSLLFTKINLVQRILGSELELPETTTKKLCWIWAAHFFIVGALNIWVAYTYSESFWVSYKLWSALLFTIAISIVTAVILIPHLKVNMDENKDDKESEAESSPNAIKDTSA